MASSLSLLETMNLLDHADQTRGRPCADPDQLLAHLRTLSAQMAIPLNDAEAVQAVATYLSRIPTEPSLPMVQLTKDRPATQAAWREAQRTWDQQLQRITRNARRWGWGVKLSMGGMAGGMILSTLLRVVLGRFYDASVPPQPDLNWGLMNTHGHWAWAALWLIPVCMPVFMVSGVKWLLLDMQQGNASHRLDLVRAVPNEALPTPELLRQWKQLPGVSAALEQIRQSDVPFLVQDYRRFDEANQEAQSQAKERLRQALTQQEQAMHSLSPEDQRLSPEDRRAHWDREMA